MPLRTRVAVRKGNRPVTYFRGTLEEAERIPHEKLAEALDRQLNPPSLLQQLKLRKRNPMTVGPQFRDHVLEQMQQMRQEDAPERTILASVANWQFLIRIRQKNGNFTIHQQPFIHEITGFRKHWTIESDPFDDLKKIIRTGFHPELERKNVHYPRPAETRKENILNCHFWGNTSSKARTKGDRYTVEFMAPVHHAWYTLPEQGIPAYPEGEMGIASARQLLRVNITMDPETTEPEKITKKIIYYKRQLRGTSLRFIHKGEILEPTTAKK